MAGNAPPVVLITGAAKRIGRTIATTLHDAGYNILIHYRSSAADAEQLALELETKRAGSALAMQAELDSAQARQELVHRCAARFRRLDALVNNASSFYPTPLAEATEPQWDDLFMSNAKAPFFLAQAAAPFLKETQGAIVNIADFYAEKPLPGHSIYCMAKAALVAMTRALAIELGPDVRVNAVSPGAVLWPDSGKPYAAQQELIRSSALKRMGSPQDIAAAVLFLLTGAPFMTGQVLRVDGGRF